MSWVAKCGAVLIITSGLPLSAKSFSLYSSSLGQQTSAQEAGSSKQSSDQTPERDAAGNYKPGKGVFPPRINHYVDPEFSDAARRKKLNGTCVVAVVVGTDGIPRDVHVVQSIATGLNKKLQSAALSLDNNAVKAVQQYRFSPGTYQGKPVPVAVKVEVSFRIY